MAGRELDRPIRISVLDRLLNDGAPVSASDDLARLREAVRRDVEWLLNTRRIYRTAPDDYPELQRSLYHYGLPDVTSLGRDAPASRARLSAQIEEALTLFEPRLASVRVSIPEEAVDARRQLHLRIQALLLLDPEPVRVSFDTVIDRTSGEVGLRESAP